MAQGAPLHGSRSQRWHAGGLRAHRPIAMCNLRRAGCSACARERRIPEPSDAGRAGGSACDIGCRQWRHIGHVHTGGWLIATGAICAVSMLEACESSRRGSLKSTRTCGGSRTSSFGCSSRRSSGHTVPTAHGTVFVAYLRLPRVSQSMLLPIGSRARAVRERALPTALRGACAHPRACACPTPPLGSRRILSPFCRPWWMRYAPASRPLDAVAPLALLRTSAWNACADGRATTHHAAVQPISRADGESQSFMQHACAGHGDETEAWVLCPKGVPCDEKSLV